MIRGQLFAVWGITSAVGFGAAWVTLSGVGGMIGLDLRPSDVHWDLFGQYPIPWALLQLVPLVVNYWKFVPLLKLVQIILPNPAKGKPPSTYLSGYVHNSFLIDIVPT